MEDDLEITFQLSRDVVVERLLNSEDYRLHQNTFETPGTETPDYRISDVTWGNETFEDKEKFKQEVLHLHYEITHYQEKFSDLTNNLEAFLPGTIIDRENKVVHCTENKETTKVRKSHEDFKITFVHKFIALEASWRKELVSLGFINDKRIPIYHPHNPLRENPVNVGAFRIYNDLDLDESTIDQLQDVTYTFNSVRNSTSMLLM